MRVCVGCYAPCARSLVELLTRCSCVRDATHCECIPVLCANMASCIYEPLWIPPPSVLSEIETAIGHYENVFKQLTVTLPGKQGLQPR